jgi:hypothetical protein
MEVEMGSVNTHALTNHIVSTRVLYHLTHQQYHQTLPSSQYGIPMLRIPSWIAH